MSLKAYIIAGEASGDLHASNLAKALKKESEIDLRGWGGDLMTDAGVDVVKHYRDLAFMGFIEVLMNLRTILKNIKSCKEDILKYKPDFLILVDYPGFNLRIAEWAKEQNIKVYYYISPQVWAWKKKRVFKIKRVVDEMFVILPFEKDWYANYDFNAQYVGHPLLDVIKKEERSPNAADRFRKAHGLDDRPIIALLPGSRKQEINTMLPIMLAALKDEQDHQVVIAGAPSQTDQTYAPYTNPRVSVLFGATYDIFKHASAGLVTSGTATLEAGLFGMPQVVCYKGSAISYAIARMLVKISYISLVNLILDREAVKELIQGDLTTKKLQQELKQILPGGNKREKMLKDYQELHQVLGGSGASAKTAKALLKSWHDSSAN